MGSGKNSKRASAKVKRERAQALAASAAASASTRDAAHTDSATQAVGLLRLIPTQDGFFEESLRPSLTKRPTFEIRSTRPSASGAPSKQASSTISNKPFPQSQTRAQPDGAADADTDADTDDDETEFVRTRQNSVVLGSNVISGIDDITIPKQVARVEIVRDQQDNEELALHQCPPNKVTLTLMIDSIDHKQRKRKADASKNSWAGARSGAVADSDEETEPEDEDEDDSYRPCRVFINGQFWNAYRGQTKVLDSGDTFSFGQDHFYGYGVEIEQDFPNDGEDVDRARTADESAAAARVTSDSGSCTDSQATPTGVASLPSSRPSTSSAPTTHIVVKPSKERKKPPTASLKSAPADSASKSRSTKADSKPAADPSRRSKRQRERRAKKAQLARDEGKSPGGPSSRKVKQPPTRRDPPSASDADADADDVDTVAAVAPPKAGKGRKRVMNMVKVEVDDEKKPAQGRRPKKLSPTAAAVAAAANASKQAGEDGKPILLQPDIIKKLADSVQCSVCLEIQCNSTTLIPCGHSFCEKCALQLQECPNCRQAISNKIHDRRSENLIGILAEIPGLLDSADVKHYESRLRELARSRERQHKRRKKMASKPPHHSTSQPTRQVYGLRSRFGAGLDPLREFHEIMNAALPFPSQGMPFTPVTTTATVASVPMNAILHSAGAAAGPQAATIDLSQPVAQTTTTTAMLHEISERNSLFATGASTTTTAAMGTRGRGYVHGNANNGSGRSRNHGRSGNAIQHFAFRTQRYPPAMMQAEPEPRGSGSADDAICIDD